MNQYQYTPRVHQDNSQLYFKNILRSYSGNSRNSTSAEGSSKSTPTKKATTPTKRQVSTDVQTPYVALLQIKSSKQRVSSAPLLSKKAQELVSQMKNSNAEDRRCIITSITPNNNNDQYVPGLIKAGGQASSKNSYQSSSIIRYTSSPSLQHSYSGITLNSCSSFGASNANLNGHVDNLFATGARLMPVQATTGAFGNNAVEIAPQPYILTVTPQQQPQTRVDQGTTKGGDMATTAKFGGYNSGASKTRRSRGQILAERPQTAGSNPAINSSFNSNDLNHTKIDVRIEGCIKETYDTTKLPVLQKKYSRNFKINQKLGINLKTNQSHNFRPGAPNNTTVTQGQNPDFNKRQRFPGGILKHANSASAKQDQSRLDYLATPRSKFQPATQENPRNKNQKPQSRECIINQDPHGNRTKSDGNTGRGPALYTSFYR